MTDGGDPLKKAAALPDAPPETFPRAFGNYMLLTPLARGGMGEVFLAKHGSVAGLEKHCVVKTLRPHLTDDREYTTRFIDEARIVVQLGHRNICHVFDVGTVGERYYLAMEFISGKDLRTLTSDVADKGGVVHPGLALHIVCEVLEALDYAHRHVDAATGTPLLLVHRDVSPQNVMLSYEGECKLIDFGLAASTLKMEQTSPNVVMGKLAYMAPEQVRGERVDGRADLFAVAVMLYEMLRGERFYDGRSPYEIWGLAAQGGFRPRSWAGLDDEIRAILDTALAAKLDDRFATCMELRDALQAYRYAHGLHGDAPMLRSLMHQVYPQDIEESRRVLVELSRAKPDSGPQARPDAPQVPWRVATEPTVSLARSPSQSLEHKRAIAAANAKEGTGPTNMYPSARTTAPKKRPSLAVAAAALIGVAGVTAAVAQYVSEPERVVVVEPAQPTLDDAIAKANAVNVAPPPPIDVEEPPAERVEIVEAPPDDEPVLARDKKRKKGPEKDKPAPGATTTTPDDKPVDVASAPPAVETASDKPVEKNTEKVLSWDALSPAERAATVVKRCAAQHECGREIAKMGKFGALNSDQLKEWKAKTQSCWKQCGLP